MIRVSSARFHLGVQLGADVKTGLSEKVNSCIIYLEPSEGIYISELNKKKLPEPIFVPNSMINCAYLDSDSLAEYRGSKQGVKSAAALGYEIDKAKAKKEK